MMFLGVRGVTPLVQTEGAAIIRAPSLIGTATIAWVLMFWGWYNLRTERRINWGMTTFLSGIVLWWYSINGWLSLWIRL
jgi:hypothetical protein